GPRAPARAFAPPCRAWPPWPGAPPPPPPPAPRPWLTRAKEGPCAPQGRVARRLGRGDQLLEFTPSHEMQRTHPHWPATFQVRAIRYQRRGFRAQLLLTSLLDPVAYPAALRSEEHTSELQSLTNLVCRLLLENKQTTLTPSPCLLHHPSDPRHLPPFPTRRSSDLGSAPRIHAEPRDAAHPSALASDVPGPRDPLPAPRLPRPAAAHVAARPRRLPRGA